MIKNLMLCLVFVTALWVDQYGGTIWLGGRYISAQPGPFVYEGVMMVPFRAVAEGLFDGEVIWNNHNRKASASFGEKNIHISIDAPDVVVVDGRLYVPIKYFED